METSHTFATANEARAFMLGFRAAASEYVFAGIDPEEKQTILVDLQDDDAVDAWLTACEEWKAEDDWRTKWIEPRSMASESLIDKARALWQTDEVEIDDDALWSESDDPGDWVQAWVWVDYSDLDDEGVAS